MKGYFSSLAKQSSVAIRGGRTSGARLPQAPMSETLAPLHSQTVLFVDSTPTAVSPVLDSYTIEKTTPHPPAPTQGPNISSQSRSTARSLAAPAISNSTRQLRTDKTLTTVAPVENSFSITEVAGVGK